MKKYCFNCGSRMEFSPKNKPKFCPNCGKPFSLSTGEEAIVDDPADSKEDGERVTQNITGLDVEYDDTSLTANKVPLGSLMGTLDKNNQNKDILKLDVPTVSEEDFLKEFQKEAGTARGPTASQEND